MATAQDVVQANHVESPLELESHNTEDHLVLYQGAVGSIDAERGTACLGTNVCPWRESKELAEEDAFRRLEEDYLAWRARRAHGNNAALPEELCYLQGASQPDFQAFVLEGIVSRAKPEGATEFDVRPGRTYMLDAGGEVIDNPSVAYELRFLSPANRFPAFWKAVAAGQIGSGEYWRALRAMWQADDAPMAHQEQWRSLWASPETGHAEMFEPAERAV